MIPLVYILDNNPLIYQNLVENTIDQFEIILISDVRVFYTSVGEKLPDLIILDIGLNHLLSGIDILKHLKETVKTNHIPIILIADDDIEFINVNPYESGANEMILKSIKLSLLVEILKKYTEVSINTIKVDNPFNSIDINSALFIENFKILLERSDIFHLNMQEIAILMNISISTFERLIKKNFGKPPLKYFNDIKLSKSEILLINKQYSLNEIANMLGFSSDSHFIHSFKKKFGKSPRLYIGSNKI